MEREGIKAGGEWFLLLLVMFLIAVGPSSQAATTNIYSTGFEVVEGYDPMFTLIGQAGWEGEGTGGNGVFSETNGFPGMGQQAYIGLFPPETNETSTTVWKPFNVTLVPTNTPIVRFSVDMEIADSLNSNYDCFRWSVYGTNVDRLFTIDFDNSLLTINYRLQNSTDFTFTGQTFSNGVRYRLEVVMDFIKNLWSATLDGALFVTNQPITTISTPLSLGDIDALWVYGDSDAPGDNFMVFDNYQVTAETAGPPPPPEITSFQRLSNGQFFLRLSGESGRSYAIEATTNLSNWTSIRTNTASGGYFDFLDTAAPSFPRRFYRGRLLP